MKYPPLVLPFVLNTPVKVILISGYNEQGEEIISNKIITKCNRKTVIQNVKDAETYKQKPVTYLYFDGALSKSDKDLKGYVEISGNRADIVSALFAYNPDGSVNYTKLVVE